MSLCLFAADLHGHEDRYDKLMEAIAAWKPRVVLLGGDLLPSGRESAGRRPRGRRLYRDRFLSGRLHRLRRGLGGDYPLVLLILGNDDPAWEEGSVAEGEAQGLWRYAAQPQAHARRLHVLRLQLHTADALSS